MMMMEVNPLFIWPSMEKLITSLCELIVRWVPHRDPDVHNNTISRILVESCRLYLSNTTLPIQLVDIHQTSKTLLLVLYSFTFAISVIGNISVVVIFAVNKNVRSVTNVFLVSLALSDLLITCFTIPFSVLAIFRSRTDNHMLPFTCKAVPYIQNVAATATVLTLCCICVERYVAILHPLAARTITALHRILGLTLGVWLISVLASIPHAIWHESVYIPDFLIKPALSIAQSMRQSGKDPSIHSHPGKTRTNTTPDQLELAFHGEMFPEPSLMWSPFGDHLDIDIEKPPVMSSFYRHGKGVSVCYVREQNREAYVIYKWVTLVAMFLIPTFLMCIAYIKIGCRLWDRSFNAKRKKMAAAMKKRTQYFNSLQTDMKTRIAKKVTAMLVVAMVLFVVSWLPHLLFEAVALTMQVTANPTSLNIRYYLEWLSVSNSCHNPVLYTLLHEKFRKILTGLFKCKKNSVSPEGNESPVSSRFPSNDFLPRPCSQKSSNDRDSPATIAVNLTSLPGMYVPPVIKV